MNDDDIFPEYSEPTDEIEEASSETVPNEEDISVEDIQNLLSQMEDDNYNAIIKDKENLKKKKKKLQDEQKKKQQQNIPPPAPIPHPEISTTEMDTYNSPERYNAELKRVEQLRQDEARRELVEKADALRRSTMQKEVDSYKEKMQEKRVKNSFGNKGLDYSGNNNHLSSERISTATPDMPVPAVKNNTPNVRNNEPQKVQRESPSSQNATSSNYAERRSRLIGSARTLSGSSGNVVVSEIRRGQTRQVFQVTHSAIPGGTLENRIYENGVRRTFTHNSAGSPTPPTRHNKIAFEPVKQHSQPITKTTGSVQVRVPFSGVATEKAGKITFAPKRPIFAQGNNLSNSYVDKVVHATTSSHAKERRQQSAAVGTKAYANKFNVNRPVNNELITGKKNANANSEKSINRLAVNPSNKARTLYASKFNLAIGTGTVMLVGGVGRALYTTLTEDDSGVFRSVSSLKQGYREALGVARSVKLMAPRLLATRARIGNIGIRVQNMGRYVKGGPLKEIAQVRRFRTGGFLSAMGSISESIMSRSDDMGSSSMLTIKHAAQYSSRLLSTSYRFGKNASDVLGHQTVRALKFAGNKTGATAALKTAKANLLNTKPAVKVINRGKKIHSAIHGGLYTSARDKAIRMAPKGLKTAAKSVSKAKSILGAAKKSKLANGIKKGVKIFTAPARAAKKAAEALKMLILKIKALLVEAIGASMGTFLAVAGVVVVIGAIFSVLMIEKTDVQSYCGYIDGLQTAFTKGIEDRAARGYDNVYYDFTDEQTFNNTKDIMSMAAVRFDQSWPTWTKFGEAATLKNYINTMFDTSHQIYYRENSYTVTVGHDKDGKPETERRIDLYITASVHKGDKLFALDKWTGDTSWEGWTDSNREWAKNIYSQDWFELYGVVIGDGSFVASPMLPEQLEEMIAMIKEQYPGLSGEREAVLRNALSLVGKVPYFWGGGHHGGLQAGYDEAWGVEMRTITADGYSKQPVGSSQPWGLDCSGFTRWVILTTTGKDSFWAGSTAQRTDKSIAISKSDLLPGDMANTGDDGHIGIYLYTDKAGKMHFVHCSPSVNGVGINTPGYFTQFFRPKVLAY
ncbi:MAG: NlpC/P60 family protein [Oscillospiraceae bacterium]